MDYTPIFKKISQELNIPIEVVSKAYNSYWKFVRETIKELPLKENLSEKDFNKLKTNFNVPSLGKLSCNYDRFVGVNKRYKYITKRKNENN